jgi:hypothetical protein
MSHNNHDMSHIKLSAIEVGLSNHLALFGCADYLAEVIRSLQIEGTKARKADYPTLPDII